jgi:hypothetical protein
MTKRFIMEIVNLIVLAICFLHYTASSFFVFDFYLFALLLSVFTNTEPARREFNERLNTINKVNIVFLNYWER